MNGGVEKHDACKRFIDCFLPVFGCNFRCSYCYRKKDNPGVLGHSPDEIGRALSRKRLGGVCNINLCADGETLLVKDIAEICAALLREGHYVSIVTNGSIVSVMTAFLDFPESWRKRVLWKFSFHYLELSRLGLLRQFFETVRMMRSAGMSVSVEMVAADEVLPFRDEILRLTTEELGAPCHLTVPRDDGDSAKRRIDDHSRGRWLGFDSEMYEFKNNTWDVLRKEFCYAGAWSALVDLGSGEWRQCYGFPVLQNVFSRPERPLVFAPVGRGCRMRHCYNGHAHLAWGVIPELPAPPYAAMRNRVCADGSTWLTEEMFRFCSTRLKESNTEYSSRQKMIFGSLLAVQTLFRGLLRNIVRNRIWSALRSPGRVRAYLRRGCGRFFRQGKLFAALLFTGGRERIFLFLTPRHSNIGDSLIAEAELNFFKSCSPGAAVFEIPVDFCRESVEIIRKKIKKDDKIVLSGGGNIGDLYEAEEFWRQTVIKTFTGNRIISFPQSIWFSPGRAGDSARLRAGEVYCGHPRFTLTVRDGQSKAFAEEHWGICAELLPDIATFYSLPPRAGNERRNILCVFRSDAETALTGKQRADIIGTCRKILPVVVTDMRHCSGISAAGRTDILRRKFDEFAGARLVVTDCLHGMLFAVLTRTPCIAMDGRTPKISSYVSSHPEQCRSVRFFSGIPCEKDILDVSNLSNFMQCSKNESFAFLEAWFNER